MNRFLLITNSQNALGMCVMKMVDLVFKKMLKKMRMMRIQKQLYNQNNIVLLLSQM